MINQWHITNLSRYR